MTCPVNILVIKQPAPRYHGVLANLGLRLSSKTGNCWIIIDDRKPGARENKIRLADRIDLWKLDAEWRPLRRYKR